MSLSGNNHVVLTSIYTLTPTHCGVGSTSGAVDLPIARESHSGLPILPASGLKGAARAALRAELGRDDVDTLFGPDTADADGLKAGALAFTEAHLLLLPVRSFVRPWLYVTAPCLIDRLNRDLRALKLEGHLLPLGRRPNQGTGPVPGTVFVSQESLGKQPLVLEDRVFPSSNLFYDENISRLAERIAALLPPEELETRTRISQGLVVVSDDDLNLLLEQCIPVQARIKLNERKTTTQDGGNLWYEESLPSDCLFVSFVMNRPGGGTKEAGALTTLKNEWKKRSYLQIGGNETVGMGFCWWTFQESAADNTPSQGGQTNSKGGGTGSKNAGGSVSRASTPVLPPALYAVPSRRPISLSAARQGYVLEKLFEHTSASQELATLLKGLPVQLRQQGLTVLVADLLRRNSLDEMRVLNVLAEWLMNDCPLQLVKERPEQSSSRRALPQALLKILIQEKTPGVYQALQAESAQLLEQSKRLAQAL